jgi:malate synthase
MAAQIPIRDDEAANAMALAKVHTDKVREVTDGHDGTWVAHPGLVPLAKEVFDNFMPEANQINRLTSFKIATQDELLACPRGEITLEGLYQNIDVGVRYLAAWLSGQGCVPLYNLMEDAATAEISRTQVWQWRRYNAALVDGTPVTASLIHGIALNLAEEDLELGEAAILFINLCTQDELTSFLTLPAYDRIKNV